MWVRERMFGPFVGAYLCMRARVCVYPVCMCFYLSNENKKSFNFYSSVERNEEKQKKTDNQPFCFLLWFICRLA